METTSNIQQENLCPFTSRLQEAIESPVENCRKVHRQRLNSLLMSLEEEMDISVLKIKLSEAALARKILNKLKNEITTNLDSVAMTDERRSYVLHQLVNAQDIDELATLLMAVNNLQISQSSVILEATPALTSLVDKYHQDLLFIAQTKQGLCITKQTFSLIAGIYADNLDSQGLIELKKLANEESILILNHELIINETLFSSLHSVELKGKSLSHSIVAITGTTGNIMTLISDMVAGKVSKLILMHHSPIEFSLKFQRTLLTIIQEIVSSDYDSHLALTLKNFWQTDMELMDFLEIPEVKMVLSASNDLNSLKQADIILCGNCPTSGFMTLDHFKHNAVVIDMTSTSAFDRDMIKQMEAERPDLSYHVIFLPRKFSLN